MLLELLGELWDSFFEHPEISHKSNIAEVEAKMRQTGQGRQDLKEFYEKDFPERAVIKDKGK